MFKQEFYIFAKKDKDKSSKNYNKLLGYRDPRYGNKEDMWTDNIFLAKHYRSFPEIINDAVMFTKQKNIHVYKVHIDPDALMERVTGDLKGGYIYDKN